MVQRGHGFFQRRVGVDPVGIEDIDVVQPQPLQALVATGDQVLPAAPFAIRSVPHQIARLAADQQLVPMAHEIRPQDLAKGRFGAAGRRAIVVGQIEMGDAMVKRRAADRALGLMRGVMAEVVPQAQRNGGQLHPRPPATAIDHPVITVLGGGIAHRGLLFPRSIPRAAHRFKLHWRRNRGMLAA